MYLKACFWSHCNPCTHDDGSLFRLPSDKEFSISRLALYTLSRKTRSILLVCRVTVGERHDIRIIRLNSWSTQWTHPSVAGPLLPPSPTTGPFPSPPAPRAARSGAQLSARVESVGSWNPTGEHVRPFRRSCRSRVRWQLVAFRHVRGLINKACCEW